MNSDSLKRAALLGVLWLTASTGGFLAEEVRPAQEGGIEFYDARQQASEFIALFHSIVLTEEQERTKNEALSVLPAPCCADKSIATCCCPCNLAKSVWGLSHFLIAERSSDVLEVRRVVQEWMEFTNQNGYTGDACYIGQCNRPFEANGCGGMGGPVR